MSRLGLSKGSQSARLCCSRLCFCSCSEPGKAWDLFLKTVQQETGVWCCQRRATHAAAAPGWASGTAHRAVRPPALRAAGEGQRSGWRDTARRSSLRGTCHRALGAPRPPFAFSGLAACLAAAAAPPRLAGDPRRLTGGREGGGAPVLSGWGPRPATAPRPGLSQLSLGRSSPGSAARTRRAARRRGRGAPPRDAAPPRCTHSHPQAAGPELPGGERGGRSTPGTLSPVKSLELGRETSARCG